MQFEDFERISEMTTVLSDIAQEWTRVKQQALGADFSENGGLKLDETHDMTGIYLRHRELTQFAVKAFGAKQVIDENGYLWYEYDVTPTMSEVMSFDATTPRGQQALAVEGALKKFKNRLVNKSVNFMNRFGMSLIQLQQLAAQNPDVIPLQVMNQLQQGYTRLKNQLLFKPQDTTKDWVKLSKNQGLLLEKLLRNESASGLHQTDLVKTGGFYAHADSVEFNEWLQTQGVDTATDSGTEVKTLFLKIKNSYQYQFNVLESVLRDILWKKFGRDTAIFSEKWLEYQKLFSEMRAQPFMPNMQFGNYVLYVTQKIAGDGQTRGRTETVFKRHFESREERDQLWLEMKKAEKTGEAVLRKDISEEQAITLAIPYDFLQAVADSEVFSQEQINLMQELLIPTRAEKFAKRWAQYIDKTPGGSDDVMRNYVAYSWHNANFIAKLKYNQEFSRAISAQRSEVNKIQKNKKLAPEVIKTQQDRHQRILDAMIEIKSYVMHPPAEFEVLRGSISLLYLNFMVKTAIMNTSTMLHTIHASMMEYGNLKGAMAFQKSLWLIKSAWGSETDSGGVRFATLEEKIKSSRGKSEIYWKNIKYAMDRAVHEGVIDQSFAYMLAGMATSGTRMKMYQRFPRSRHAHAILDFGMIPFRTVEKANRIVSLLTFYQLELAKGSDSAKAYDAATEKTLLLQNDYTKGNRPKLLRGNASLVTIFLSYGQFMGWLMTGGYDRSLKAKAEADGSPPTGTIVNFTTRMWITYLMLGGLMGLPFAENIMDLLQFVWRKFFGKASPEYELKKMVQEITGHSNLVMHGLLHNVPTPLGAVDLSGSFGLGRLIPGTEPLATVDTKTFPEAVGGFAQSLTGVFGSFVKSLWDFAAASNNPDRLQALPGITGKIGASYNSYENGIMTRSGIRLYKDPETGEFIKENPAIAVLQILGFNIAEVSEARKSRAMSFEIAQFYTSKQQLLMLNRNMAITKSDRESLAEAEKNILEFNKNLPEEFKRMSITGKTKSDSLRTYRQRTRKAEAGQAPNRKQGGIYRSVNALNEEE